MAGAEPAITAHPQSQDRGSAKAERYDPRARRILCSAAVHLNKFSGDEAMLKAMIASMVVWNVNEADVAPRQRDACDTVNAVTVFTSFSRTWMMPRPYEQQVIHAAQNVTRAEPG